MFWLKSCPRCHGDLHDESDIYGSYIDCFQCGHYLSVVEEAILRSESPHGSTFPFSQGQPVKVLAEMAA